MEKLIQKLGEIVEKVVGIQNKHEKYIASLMVENEAQKRINVKLIHLILQFSDGNENFNEVQKTIKAIEDLQ